MTERKTCDGCGKDITDDTISRVLTFLVPYYGNPNCHACSPKCVKKAAEQAEKLWRDAEAREKGAK